MSKVFNMVGGGGGKNISSIVITGLESTDTVTCTKGGKSYHATWDATAQHWEIVGLPLGTFTVTATNGTNTITETVLIDIAGVYEIEMVMKVWLYNGDDSGNEFTDITGGWGITGYSQSGWTIAAGTKESNCFNMTSVNQKIMALGTAKTIDLTKYTRLYAVTYGNCEEAFWYCVNTSKTNFYTNQVKGKKNPDGDRITTYIDISSLSGAHYVTLRNGSQNASYVGKLYRMWLE